MSTGVFMSILESFVDEAQDEAQALLDAVNTELVANGLEPIVDSGAGPHVGEGRTALDHMGARTLAAFGTKAGPTRPHTQLLAANPYQLVYVPRVLAAPAALSPGPKAIGTISLGSSRQLHAELLDMAPELGIPLDEGRLDDAVATKINDLEPLAEGEDDWDLIEDWRVCWLLLHEAAVLSMERQVPISLAG